MLIVDSQIHLWQNGKMSAHHRQIPTYSVDDALGQKLSAMIWDGDITELTLTENAQPALMACSIAAMANCFCAKSDALAKRTLSHSASER